MKADSLLKRLFPKRTGLFIDEAKTWNKPERERQMEIIHCSVCGKQITNSRVSEPDECGQRFSINNIIGVHVGCSLETSGNDEYIKEQFGPYFGDSNYNICMECWLRSLGVPEPKPKRKGNDNGEG